MNTAIDVDRFIPFNLFPPREINYTTRWAETNFKYCHLFLESINYEQIKGNGDVELWKKRGLEIRNELSKYGSEIGKQYLLEIATKRFNLKFSEHDTVTPTSVDDIVSIFGNKMFYMSAIEVRREQLYSLMYGVFRNGDNMWLMKGEQTKLDEYRVKYEAITKRNSTEEAQRKGCFYRAMKINFSQQIIRKFQIMMDKQHGEYITSRKKDIKLKEDKRVISKLHLSRASVWLVKTRHDVEEDTDADIGVMKEGENWIKRCKKFGYDATEILQNVKYWVNEQYMSQDITDTKGM